MDRLRKTMIQKVVKKNSTLYKNVVISEMDKDGWIRLGETVAWGLKEFTLL